LKGYGINHIIGDIYSKGGEGGSGGSGGSGASCTYAGGWGCGSSQSITTNTGNVGDSGGGGGGGRIKIFASDCNGNIVLPNTDLFGGNGVNFGAAGYLHVANNLPCNGVTPPPVGFGKILKSKFTFLVNSELLPTGGGVTPLQGKLLATCKYPAAPKLTPFPPKRSVLGRTIFPLQSDANILILPPPPPPPESPTFPVLVVID
jgi:hypothetical protein